MKTIRHYRIPTSLSLKLRDYFKQTKENFLVENLSFLDKLTKEDSLVLQLLKYGILSQSYPKMFDLDFAKKFIKNTIEINEIPNSDNFITYWKPLLDEEKFDTHFRQKYLEIEKKAFELFYKQYSNCSKFEMLCDFNCFNDVIILENEIEQYFKKASLYLVNINGWVNYCIRLYEYFYPEYQQNTKFSDKQFKRFLKKINENEYLGFEIDVRELKNDTKKFGPNIIEANIIYILKTEKIQNEEKKIEIFEITELKHPFFKTMTTLRFFFLDYLYEKDKFGNNLYFKPKPKYAIERINDEKVRLYSEHLEFGIDSQKMAFFQMYLDSIVNNTYLNYLYEGFCFKN